MKISGPLCFLKIQPAILVGSILLAVGMPKEVAAQIQRGTSNIPDKDGVVNFSTQIPADATEAWIIDMIKKLGNPKSIRAGEEPIDQYQFVQEAPYIRIHYVDQLLERYPATRYRNEATIAKLKSLGEVAPKSYNRTRELASITSIIQHNPPSTRVAEQAEFFNIRAYQLLARHENISEERWLPGAIRRYEEFIRRFPKSEHAVRIYAFWVRETMSAGRQLDANDVVGDMVKLFPDHPLSKLSLDRVTLSSLVGQPYKAQLTTFKGETIKSDDLKGKVLVVHYWHPDSRESTGIIGELIRINAKFHDNYGMQMIGVVQSSDEAKIKKARKLFMTAWPQCKNELDPSTGKPIHRFHVAPAFLVVDADGMIASIAFDISDLYKKVRATLIKKP